MGTLLEGIKSRQADQRRGGRCLVGLALNTLSPSDRKDIDAALADPSIFGTVIADVLAETTETNVTKHSVIRHRRGECLCGRRS